MKILWLDLNSSYAHASLALPALHAQVMHDPSLEWGVVSATINENPGMTAGEVVRQAPDILAATCWLFNHEVLMHVISRVKAMLPRCVVALGGPEFLGHNEDFLRTNRFVGCVFRGEGEETFPQWLACWQQPKEWTRITGLCFLDTEGQYHDNGLSRVMAFDKLVNPEQSPFFNWSKPFVQLETTRGCFNTCAFCVSGGEKPVRTLSVEAIRERVRLIHEKGIRNIRVLDRTFNYQSHRAKALFDLFREFPDMRFHLEIHPALLSEELKQELASMPKGLRYLCALDNMETHADLIAGLPLYHLSQIFDDVRTLAEYRAGEIQLESLKLLPGTEMRRRAEELGICYSPLPPYEVLQTREITPDELQTARQLSRLLDGFYNAPAWQEITRRLIVEEPDFLTRFLDHLIQIGVIDQPMGLERRGILLYHFCKEHYPLFLTAMSRAWIEAGMSLKKEPAERVRTKHVTPPEAWTVCTGTYRDDLRLCKLPAPEEGRCYWYGFETESQQLRPVFAAVSEELTPAP